MSSGEGRAWSEARRSGWLTDDVVLRAERSQLDAVPVDPEALNHDVLDVHRRSVCGVALQHARPGGEGAAGERAPKVRRRAGYERRAATVHLFRHRACSVSAAVLCVRALRPRVKRTDFVAWRFIAPRTGYQSQAPLNLSGWSLEMSQAVALHNALA